MSFCKNEMFSKFSFMPIQNSIFHNSPIYADVSTSHFRVVGGGDGKQRLCSHGT